MFYNVYYVKFSMTAATNQASLPPISSMAITDDRRKVIDFSDKYYNTPSGIVVKEGTPYSGLASLKG